MKQFFRTLFLVALVFGAAQTLLFAQNETPQREVGLRFGSLNLNNSDFSAIYKKQKSENEFRRIRVFAANLTAGAVDDDFQIAFTGGLAIGTEKRKTLDPKLVFFKGPELILGVGLNNDLAAINLGFGYVFGLQHNFNEHWAVNLEAIPGLSLAVVRALEEESGAVLFNGGFSNSVALSILRRF